MYQQSDLRNLKTTPYLFRNSDIVYIGPFSVAEKKTTEKKYIWLFTCVTTRAIHLETMDCLSADKCITAIRHVKARRGNPHKILSDKASCFVGAPKETKATPIEIDSDSNRNVMTNHEIDWKINLPSIPHFGEVRERIVSKVKLAFLISIIQPASLRTC